MTIALIAGSSKARLWGLTGHERIARQLDHIGGITLTLGLESIASQSQVLILRTDYAYDLSTLNGLLEQRGILMDGAEPAAAHVPGSLAAAALETINRAIAQSAGTAPGAEAGVSGERHPTHSLTTGEQHPTDSTSTEEQHPTAGSLATKERHSGDSLATAERHPADSISTKERHRAASVPTGERHPTDSIPTIDTDSLASFNADLRKSEPPLLQRIEPGPANSLEDRLYGMSYKGITDFITKWWWPVPAKALVRWCARWGISPNMVTITGFALMLATCWLFYEGLYAWGLALGWIMTFLDTVDGKLARVTVRSSKFGHWLDHGMDIVHPPFWYWLWGLSLADFEPRLGIGFEPLIIILVAGYIAGRLIEGAFHGLGSVSLFAWRPFDAWFRLFAARRNPCLVLLTAGWLLGKSGLGFELVAYWTLLSSIILLGRLALAAYVRATRGPLTSWLTDAAAPRNHPRSYRMFSATRRAYE